MIHMDDKAYYKEHSELIHLLRSTANKLEQEANKQAAEVKKMKGGLKGGMEAPQGSLVSTAVATPKKEVSSSKISGKVSTKSSPVPAQQSTQDVQALLNAAIARLQAMQPPQQQGSGNETASKLEKALQKKRMAEMVYNKLPAQMIEAAAMGDFNNLVGMQHQFARAQADKQHYGNRVKRELGKGKGKKKCILGIKGGCGLCGGC